ncbi:hypothetical protein RvY_13406, partial [Ramazzottius varieornatus]
MSNASNAENAIDQDSPVHGGEDRSINTLQRKFGETRKSRLSRLLW